MKNASEKNRMFFENEVETHPPHSPNVAHYLTSTTTAPSPPFSLSNRLLFRPKQLDIVINDHPEILGRSSIIVVNSSAA